MPAHAGVFQSAEQFSLTTDDVIEDDLYASGGSVNIAGAVNGDLLVAGGSLSILGPIAEDVMAAGGSIQLFSDIGGDVRIAGGQISIKSVIKGDLIVAGGTLNLLPGSVVEGDLVMTGGQLTVDGEIKGKSMLAGGAIQLAGSMGGDVDVTSEQLDIAKTSVIVGNLKYSGERPAKISAEASITGDYIFEKWENKVDIVKAKSSKHIISGIAGVLGLIFFGKFFVLLFTVLLLVTVFKKKSADVVAAALKGFWRNAGIGLVVGIVVPVALIIGFVSILGWQVASIVAGVFGLGAMIAKLYAPVVLGVWVAKAYNKERKIDLKWQRAMAGVILVSVLMLVPIVGWIINLILMLAAFGALSEMAYKGVKKWR